MACVHLPNPALSALLALLGAGPAAAAPRPGEDLTVLGFSRDGKVFAIATAAPGERQATLRLWDVDTGKPVDRELPGVPLAGRRAAPPPGVLARLDLGRDPGAERYTSGTALETSFVAGAARVRVVLSPRISEPASGGRVTGVVSVSRGRCTTELATGAHGHDFNLASVRVSRGGRSLAVVFKYTETRPAPDPAGAPLRRYGVAAVPLAWGDLDRPGCREEGAPPTGREARGGGGGPDTPAACLDRLRSLHGRYRGVERVKGSGGEADVPLYRLTIGAGDPPTVSLLEGPGGAAVACGAVAGCRLDGGTLLVTTHDASGECDDAPLRIAARPDGAVEVEAHGFLETYLRE